MSKPKILTKILGLGVKVRFGVRFSVPWEVRV